MWTEIDLLQFVARQLYAIDRQFYPAGQFAGFSHVEEVARVAINAERVAIVCRSDRGIYEVEGDLKKVYGKRLGAIVLDKGGGNYTLRLVDRFLPATLEAAYDRLNLADPAVHAGDPGNTWGGAADIGGSPRKSGSRLGPRRDRRPAAHRAAPAASPRAGRSAVVSGGAAGGRRPGADLAADGGAAAADARSRRPGPARSLLLSTSVVALLLAGRSRQRFYGLMPPRGRQWMWMLVPGAVGGLVGGAWTRGITGPTPSAAALAGRDRRGGRGASSRSAAPRTERSLASSA